MKNVTAVFLLFFLLTSIKGFASHIFGGDLSYSQVSGNTYEIKLILYGDCSGNSFPNLFSSAPLIQIYNGNSAYSSITLLPSGIPGLEVTPVCPSEILNTKCNGGTLPGVAQFIFVGNITLSGPSSNWKFLFNGNLGGNSYAGRSNAITNINQAQYTTIMKLEATLNNTAGPNKSAEYTTIPTPFFCINVPQQYNQGAIDGDGDILSFELVTGLDGSNNGGGVVNYISPYSYLAPLATAGGTYSFSNTTGQLSFQPNTIQNSLVVSKVVETRNGVVVGTSMREMTFVVLNNCNNQSPTGVIANSNFGTILNNTIHICKTGIQLQFSIQASDPDNDSITASVSGSPGGLTYTVTGNNTPQATINVSWSVPANLTFGTTTFYVTFQDNNCPLSSKQTIAYTIVYDQPITASTTVEDISCIATNDGQIIINASSTNGNLSYSLNGGSFQSGSTFSGLTQGTYTVQIKDPQNCSIDLEVLINGATNPVIDILDIKNITCHGRDNGIISLSAKPTNRTYNYYLNPSGSSNTTGLFTNLSQNNYTVIAVDNKECKDTITAQIIEPPVLAFGKINVTNLTCNKNNGKIIATSNAISEGTYILSPGLKSNNEGYFDNLTAGLYTVSVLTGEDCKLDSVVYLGKDPQTFFIATTKQNLPCNGWGNEGEASVNTIGGIPPYVYNWNSSPTQTTAKASNLFYGWYIVSVTDATGCEQQDTIYIEPSNCCENIFLPNAFSPNGDGINDEWKMVTTTGMEIKEFAVFNRFGQKLWSTQNQHYAWDGTYQNDVVELGTYFYVLKYKCLTDGKTYIKKGDIIIVR